MEKGLTAFLDHEVEMRAKKWKQRFTAFEGRKDKCEAKLSDAKKRVAKLTKDKDAAEGVVKSTKSTA